MFFCQDVTDHCTLAESSDSHIFVCRDHSAPPLLGGKRGMGSLGFRWSYADNLVVLDRGANSTYVHLARLIAGYRKLVSVFTMWHTPAEVPMFSVMKCRRPSHIVVERGKRLSRMRSVARTVSSRRRISGRAMELVNGHESFLTRRNRGALSILDTGFKFARASYLIPGEALVNCPLRAKRALGGLPCILRSNRSLCWLDVCI